MKQLGFACLLLFVVTASVGQTVEPLCPRHIETPSYPQIARSARVTGKVIMSVPINGEGHVEKATAANQDERVPLLGRSSIDNIRHWTFEKPPSAPYVETIVYDYEIDSSLPVDNRSCAIQRVNFDLPDRVTIFANETRARY